MACPSYAGRWRPLDTSRHKPPADATAPLGHGTTTLSRMTSLDSALDRLEANAALALPRNLRDRAEALDWLERMFPEPLPGEGTAHTELDARAQALRQHLEAADARLFQALRGAVLQGRGADSLAPWLDDMPAGGDAYDHLDALLSGILQLEPPAAPSIELSAEMVFYQPTPARHIFGLLRQLRLAPHDVLVDIGCGLGHVPLLAAILTGARSFGIELEPAYVASARRAADALGLDRVRFDIADARAADYTAGTVFYLYTPFRGAVLRDVLDALRAQSRQRAIRICTYGPCTTAVAREEWLEPTGHVSTERVVVFSSRNVPPD